MANFTAGWNQPGELPESDPAEFDTFDEAKRYIIDQMLQLADDVAEGGDEDLAEEITNDAEDVNLESREFVTGPYDGDVYWVAASVDQG